jgi:hypothetical protein
MPDSAAAVTQKKGLWYEDQGLREEERDDVFYWLIAESELLSTVDL